MAQGHRTSECQILVMFWPPEERTLGTNRSVMIVVHAGYGGGREGVRSGQSSVLQLWPSIYEGYPATTHFFFNNYYHLHKEPTDLPRAP